MYRELLAEQLAAEASERGDAITSNMDAAGDISTSGFQIQRTRTEDNQPPT